MTLAQATASLLLASVLWAPLGPTDVADETPAGDTMVIRVEIPARAGAPATPVPSPSAVVVPAPDAGHPRPGTLPATGADAALWVGAIGLGAIAAGAAARARRRRRA